jgi:hypothetical protein
MRGGLAETWAMAWVTRARTAETPKQLRVSTINDEADFTIFDVQNKKGKSLAERR